ncbi:hypothetical protein R1sor_006618 [Riccia sorocarpa]|uniref:Uncharacterized protein n=1 Tax=Riccia sorocarpa TaxID=122646 RepID=A0ABD3HRK0_9MARC
MMWNFFCSGHGKGEHDGQGAVVKSPLRQHQMRRPEGRFDCASDVVEFCIANMQRGLKENIRRVFWEVKEDDVERNCIGGHEEACEWQEWVTEWHHSNLTVTHVTEELEPETLEPHIDMDHEFLSDSIVLGDVFAVKADDPVIEYYLLQCTGVKQKITQKKLRCAWNQEHVFTRDEVVLFGTYFELSSLTKDKVVFVETENRDDAVIYSHLVRAAKIDVRQMKSTGKKKRNTPRVFIDLDTHESILAAVNEDDAPEHTRRSGPFLE